MHTQSLDNAGHVPAAGTWHGIVRGVLWLLPVSLLAGASADVLAATLAPGFPTTQVPDPAVVRHVVEAATLLLGLWLLTRTQHPPVAATHQPLIKPFARSMTVCGSVPDLGRMIDQRLGGNGALRLMIAGAKAQTWVAEDALALANLLAAAGKSTLLIDWRPDTEKGCAHIAGLKPARGLTEVLCGRATCANLVRTVPGHAVHLLTAGFESMADLDLDRRDLAETLDDLDRSYDYILMTGNQHDARALFEAIEGRIDAAVTIGKGGGDHNGRFLGIAIFDLDLFHLETYAVPTPVPTDRLRRMLKPTRSGLGWATA